MPEYWKGVFIWMLVLCKVACYKHFQELIPNGNRVPHPCLEGEIWHGVGHRLGSGTGPRNPFGELFEKNGKVWNERICRVDTDGDGMTNGQELGDPNCVWSPGRTPEVTDPAKLSHPGICTPWNSPRCQASTNAEPWVQRACENQEFVCPAIEEGNIVKVPARLPLSQVPSAKTTYACVDYVFQGTNEYHMVATTPAINNTNVVHHIVLFGCHDSETPLPDTGVWYVCDMTPSRACQDIISTWTYGMAGECLHSNVGVRIGPSGYKRIALQVHYNNPKEVAGYQDNSGMTLYLTRKLKQYDAGVLLLGNEHFEIPPGKTSYVVNGVCSPNCTQTELSDKIYLTRIFNHMHYLGTSMRVELVRDGESQLIAEDLTYNYDSPTVHFFPDPIEVRPGDEIRTRCVFNSMEKNVTTYYGEATHDEMCFAFVNFYPKPNHPNPFCTSWKTIPKCYLNNLVPFEGCDFTQFWPYSHDHSLKKIYKKLLRHCNQMYCKKKKCIPLVKKIRENPCFRGDIYDYIIFLQSFNSKWNNVVGFHSLLSSCDEEINNECTSPTCGASSLTISILYVLFLYLFIS